MLAVIILWLVFAVLVGVYASSKGRSGVGFFFIAILLSPLVGFIIALVVQPIRAKLEAAALQSGEFQKCPYCAEIVKVEAVVCKHCGKDIPAKTVEPEAPSAFEKERQAQREAMGKREIALAAERQATLENSSAAERRSIFEHTMKAFEKSGNIQDDQIALATSYVDTNPEVAQVTDRVYGNTLLHICVQRELTAAAAALVKAGADTKAPNGNAQTPVSLATSNAMRDVLGSEAASAHFLRPA